MTNDTPRPRYIVRGQKVEESKVAAAKMLRRAMTPAETLLWRHLHNRRLHGFHFRRQQIIRGFIADFYCHRAALVVECDGSVHDASYDAERDGIFAALGIRVLRFPNEDVLHHTENVLQTIARHLSERDENPHPASPWEGEEWRL